MPQEFSFQALKFVYFLLLRRRGSASVHHIPFSVTDYKSGSKYKYQWLSFTTLKENGPSLFHLCLDYIFHFLISVYFKIPHVVWWYLSWAGCPELDTHYSLRGTLDLQEQNVFINIASILATHSALAKTKSKYFHHCVTRMVCT